MEKTEASCFRKFLTTNVRLLFFGPQLPFHLNPEIKFPIAYTLVLTAVFRTSIHFQFPFYTIFKSFHT